MGDPGNPSDPSGASGPDPGQPGWASPTPPAQPTPPQSTPAWGTPPPPPPTTPSPTPGDAGWTPPPPPVKKRKLTWLWILIPVLLVFFASVIVIIVFVARAVIGPLEATDDYFTLLRQERYAEAYDARCERFQNQLTEEEFVQRETVNGPVGDFDFNDNEFDTDGDDATTSGDVERSGFQYNVTVRLEKEDGDWKVCTIEAERQTG